jgi:hypothetical protein
MNPAGWVPDPTGDGSRLYFSKFRLPFTDAGFEVIDCPRLTHTKNGADIRLVLDAAEALRADVRYEEFVIASGDSDITPLLVRLRAADRRLTVLSPSDAAEVLGAIADRLIGGAEFVELLEDPVDQYADESFEGSGEVVAPTNAPTSIPPMDSHDARVAFAESIRERYDNAPAPLNLATLAQQVRSELGPVTASSRWFGYGTFTRALQAQSLPDVRMTHHYVWDASRHEAPDEDEARTRIVGTPEAIARVTSELRLPRLTKQSWAKIYEALATFVAAYEFNLTEATRWSRDRLVDQGVEVSRKAVNVVALGASYGGCPLYRQPAPTAAEIGEAFVGNILNRASAADVDLGPEDEDDVRSWFSA